MNKNAINEDMLHCKFYSTSLQTDWKELCFNIDKVIATKSSDYLWHKDIMKVIIPLQYDQDSLKYLESATCFGDNIEDEWFMVHLVYEITKHFDELVVQLADNDGDFLLIEAANYLPKWIKPDNMENRVFVYQNSLHIIPPELVELNINLEMERSIKIIKEHPDITKACNSIQSAILKRIGNQPKDYITNLHIAAARLPIELAVILKLKPFLISHIVDAYCNHDIIDSKQCKEIIVYDIDNSVNVKVHFTKCLYAMMLHSKLMKTKASVALDKNDKKSVLGYKLTCGFQMIMNKLSKETTNQKSFILFIKSLKDNGYFKENIEGSKEYQTLLEKAKDYFKSTVNSDSDIAQMILKVMDTEEFSKQRQELKSFPDFLHGDSEHWMTIQSDQLNDILNARFGKQVKLENDVTPDTLTKELSKFLYQSSDLEGIEINEADCSDDAIEFDENEFAESLEKMLNMVAPRGPQERSTSSSSDDEPDSCDDDQADELDACLDREIRSSLASDIIGLNTNENKKTTMDNILRSLQEEKGYTGPSSNILKNIGLHKNNILDSDDDSE